MCCKIRPIHTTGGVTPTVGFLDNVHRQGAGMLDIDDAILATTVVTPAKIATGESQAGPFTQTLTVSNFGAAPVTYTLSHLPALATGSNTFVPSFLDGFAAVSFSAPTVTVPAGGSATVNVTITANAGLPDSKPIWRLLSSSHRLAAVRHTLCLTPVSRVTTSRFRYLDQAVSRSWSNWLDGRYDDNITAPFSMVGT